MIMDAVDSYLCIRRAAGFELGVPEYLLRSFARYADERGQSHIFAQSVIDWSSQAPSLNQRANRLDTVIRFARHMHVEDDRHEIPKKGIFGRKTRKTPYIFTPIEVNNLLQAAIELRPVNSIRPHVYSTLIALLISTGMRISEALALTFSDITPEGIIIRDTKFKKSRLVPLHQTAQLKLQEYLDRRQKVVIDSPHIFISIYGTTLVRSSVQWTFRQLLKTIKLDSPPCGRRPRIHDLRHTFACRALQSCPEGRNNVGRHMVALSTYLGHSHISDTYWYLESTPELMQDISMACQSFSQRDLL